MLDALGVPMDQVGKFFVAGAFGTYLDKESAVTLGLYPVSYTHLDVYKRQQHIVLGKVCETCFDFVIFLYDGRIDFTMLGYCWHWHK